MFAVDMLHNGVCVLNVMFNSHCYRVLNVMFNSHCYRVLNVMFNSHCYRVLNVMFNSHCYRVLNVMFNSHCYRVLNVMFNSHCYRVVFARSASRFKYNSNTMTKIEKKGMFYLTIYIPTLLLLGVLLLLFLFVF